LVEGTVPEFLAGIGLSRNTVDTYDVGLRRFVKWLRKDAESITRQTLVSRYMDFLSGQHSAYTVPTYVAAVGAFFRWCAETYDNFPAIKTKVRCRKPKGHARNALTLAEAQQLLAAVDTRTLKGKRDKAILALLVGTGLRRSEALNAQLRDLVEQDGQHVLRFQGKGRVDRNQTKVVTPAIYALVQDYLAARAEAKPLDPEQYLFVSLSRNNRFGKMSGMGLSRIAKRYLREIGKVGRGYTCHSLRHTAVSLTIAGTGGNVLKAQALAGHSNINTTMVYVHEYNRMQDPPEAVVSKMLMADSNRREG